LALVDVRAHGIVHVTNSGQTNWREFAQAALETFGIDRPVGAITSADWQKLRPNTAARPSYSVLDLSEFNRLTGRQMRPWRQGLSAFKAEVDRAGQF
jgi:dTDP-4-dehydrorhamnose reductase